MTQDFREVGMAETAIPYRTTTPRAFPRIACLGHWAVLCAVFLVAVTILGCLAAARLFAVLAAPTPQAG
jgi:hypothetical protein